MKIAVVGKGGTGKTTISYELSKKLSKNFKVIAIDADSSLNLSLKFNINGRSILEISELVDRAKIDGILINMRPYTKDIVDKYSINISENLKLLVVGGNVKVGNGCLCPENALLRAILRELILNRDEFVVIDMEAGFEFMGRRTIENIDEILILVEPSIMSISVAKNLINLAKNLNIKTIKVVANKIHKNYEIEFIKRNLDYEIFHILHYSDAELKKSMNIECKDENFDKEIEELKEKIINDRYDIKELVFINK